MRVPASCWLLIGVGCCTGAGGWDTGAGTAAPPQQPDAGLPAARMPRANASLGQRQLQQASSSRCDRPPQPPAVRSRLDVTAVVVFSELMYHPAASSAAVEWLELHNILSVDVDLSRWRLDGAVEYTFPQGTLLAGGAYLVVSARDARVSSSHVYSGHLSNSGERLNLYLLLGIYATKPSSYPYFGPISGLFVTKLPLGVGTTMQRD